MNTFQLYSFWIGKKFLKLAGFKPIDWAYDKENGNKLSGIHFSRSESYTDQVYKEVVDRNHE